METRVVIGDYLDAEERISEQKQKDRRILVSAILLALFIIICIIGIILIFDVMEPEEIKVFKPGRDVDIPGIMREAREAMKGLPHN